MNGIDFDYFKDVLHWEFSEGSCGTLFEFKSPRLEHFQYFDPQIQGNSNDFLKKMEYDMFLLQVQKKIDARLLECREEILSYSIWEYAEEITVNEFKIKLK